MSFFPYFHFSDDYFIYHYKKILNIESCKNLCVYFLATPRNMRATMATTFDMNGQLNTDLIKRKLLSSAFQFSLFLTIFPGFPLGALPRFPGLKEFTISEKLSFVFFFMPFFIPPKPNFASYQKKNHIQSTNTLIYDAPIT